MRYNMLRKRGIQQLKRYCREPMEKIKGYREAVESEGRYDCHHINELTFTRDELKKMNMYYNRPASELILLKASDHIRLHQRHDMPSARYGTKASMYGRRGESHPRYGKGYLQLGSKNPMYGRTGNSNPAWKENPISSGAWYRRAKDMLKAGLITEEEAKEYRKIGAEIAKSKRNNK